jgi:ribonuclease HI
VEINKSIPLGYFDGTCEGRHQICGIGFMFIFSDDHYVTGRENMGSGSNNQVEFQELFALLKCVMRYNIHTLQAFGDSKFFIDWMTNANSIDNLEILNIGQNLKVVSATFQFISFRHVFSEQNDKVDSLSKVVINMNSNLLFHEDFFGGELISHMDQKLYVP